MKLLINANPEQKRFFPLLSLFPRPLWLAPIAMVKDLRPEALVRKVVFCACARRWAGEAYVPHSDLFFTLICCVLLSATPLSCPTTLNPSHSPPHLYRIW